MFASFLQCNLQRSLEVTADFAAVMAEHKVQVGITQEPGVSRNFGIGMNDMRVYASNDMKAALL